MKRIRKKDYHFVFKFLALGSSSRCSIWPKFFAFIYLLCVFSPNKCMVVIRDAILIKNIP